MMRNTEVEDILRELAASKVLHPQDRMMILQNIKTSMENSVKGQRNVQTGTLWDRLRTVFTSISAAVIVGFVGISVLYQLTKHNDAHLAMTPTTNLKNNRNDANKTAHSPREAVTSYLTALQRRDVEGAVNFSIDKRFLVQKDQIDFLKTEVLLNQAVAKFDIKKIVNEDDTHAIAWVDITQSGKTNRVILKCTRNESGWVVYIPNSPHRFYSPENSDFTGTSVLSNARLTAPFHVIYPKVLPANMRKAYVDVIPSRLVSVSIGNSIKGASIRQVDIGYVSSKPKLSTKYITVREQPDVGRFIWLSQLEKTKILGNDAWVDTTRPNLPQIITWHRGLMINVFGNVSVSELKRVLASMLR